MAARQQSLLNVQNNLANVIKNIESNLFTRIQRLENNVIDKIDSSPSNKNPDRATQLKELHSDKLPEKPGEVLMIVEFERSVALTADEQVAFAANGVTYSTIPGVTVTHYDSSSLLVRETIEIDDYTNFGIPWQSIFGDVLFGGYAASAEDPANGIATTLNPNTYAADIAKGTTSTRQYIFTYAGEREAVEALWSSTASSPTWEQMAESTQGIYNIVLATQGVTDLAAARAAFPTDSYLANAKAAVEDLGGGFTLVVQEA